MIPHRNCIGQEFALIYEEKVVHVLPTILRNLELSLDETKPVLKEYLVILHPNKDGLYQAQAQSSLMCDSTAYHSVNNNVCVCVFPLFIEFVFSFNINM